MSTKQESKLAALLSGNGRELLNIKFFHGTDENLTAEELRAEAAKALDQAFDENGKLIVEDCPPVSGYDRAKSDTVVQA